MTKSIVIEHLQKSFVAPTVLIQEKQDLAFGKPQIGLASNETLFFPLSFCFFVFFCCFIFSVCKSINTGDKEKMRNITFTVLVLQVSSRASQSGKLK